MMFRYFTLATVFFIFTHIPISAVTSVRIGADLVQLSIPSGLQLENGSTQTGVNPAEVISGPGDKGKKKKKGKDEDESTNKMSRKKHRPAKSARASVRNSKRALRMKESQLHSRAKVRNFFHKSFNTKVGRSVNFRKRRQRNRWKKGR